MGRKRKELTPPHCLQIKYLYFTLTVSIGDFLSLPTERNENSIRCCFIVKLNVNNYHDGIVVESPPKIGRSCLEVQNRSLSFNLFIDSFT